MNGQARAKRATIAAMKPNAAARQLSLCGTTSCSAPQARPPCGRWESMAARPNGRPVCNPAGCGSRRRNSAMTAARWEVDGAVMAGCRHGVDRAGDMTVDKTVGIAVDIPVDIAVIGTGVEPVNVRCMFLVAETRT